MQLRSSCPPAYKFCRFCSPNVSSITRQTSESHRQRYTTKWLRINRHASYGTESWFEEMDRFSAGCFTYLIVSVFIDHNKPDTPKPEIGPTLLATPEMLLLWLLRERLLLLLTVKL